MLHVYIDTNLFLEFRPIRDLNWLEALSEREVTLVLPHSTVAELNQKKDSRDASRKKKERAKRALDFIEKEVLAARGPLQLRQGVAAVYDSEHPGATLFEAHRLSPSDHDACLVASVIHGSERGQSVLLVSDDAGARALATVRGIRTLDPPEEWRLPAELDPVETELQSLRRENAELKDRLPHLFLSFRGAKNILEHELPKERDVGHYVEQYLELLDGIHNPKSATFQATFAGLSAMFAPGAAARYERDFVAYLEKCREVLPHIIAHQNQADRVLELHLELTNSGRAPAEDVLVVLRTELQLKDQVTAGAVERPYLPPPPRRPRTVFDRFDTPFERLGALDSISLASVHPLALGTARPYIPHWHVELGAEVSEAKLELGDIRHHTTMALPILQLVLPDVSSRIVPIEALIHARNLAQPKAMNLLVKLSAGEKMTKLVLERPRDEDTKDE